MAVADRKPTPVICALDADPIATISVYFVYSVSLIVAAAPTYEHQNLDGTPLRWLTVIVVFVFEYGVDRFTEIASIAWIGGNHDGWDRYRIRFPQ